MIAGVGLAGAATAIACAHRGLGVRLFERAVFSGHRPGETLHPGIEPLLRQLGLAGQIRSGRFGRYGAKGFGVAANCRGMVCSGRLGAV